MRTTVHSVACGRGNVKTKKRKNEKTKRPKNKDQRPIIKTLSVRSLLYRSSGACPRGKDVSALSMPCQQTAPV